MLDKLITVKQSHDSVQWRKLAGNLLGPNNEGFMSAFYSKHVDPLEKFTHDFMCR